MNAVARPVAATRGGVPMDIGTSSLDDFASWDQVVNPRGRDRDNEAPIVTLKAGQYAGTISWLRDDEDRDEEHTDGIGATEAVRLLECFARERRPFFLGVGFYRPHTPFVAPKKYFDLHPLEQIWLPPLSADDHGRTPAAAYASAQAEQDTEWDVDGGIARQLFDEESDPDETTNLAARPEHALRIAGFARLLAEQRMRR